MLNRAGKIWGTRLKNNVHESPSAFSKVSCTIQGPAYDLELANCDDYCCFWALLCGPESSRMGTQQGKEQYSQERALASEDEVGMDGPFRRCFSLSTQCLT